MGIAVTLERVTVADGISNVLFTKRDFNTPSTERWAFKSPPLKTGQVSDSSITQ